MASTDWELTAEDGLLHRYICEWCGESIWLRHYEDDTGSWLSEYEEAECENCGSDDLTSGDDYSYPDTYWNGEKTACRPVHIRVVDDGKFANAWYSGLAGTVRSVVEVSRKVSSERYRGQVVQEVFYIDNEGGAGWQKVTKRKGSPQCSHRNISGELVRDVGRNS